MSNKTFKPRNRTKPDVYVLPSDPPLFVKDYGNCNFLVRWYGRYCLHCEEKALRRLAGVKGIPPLYRRIGLYALVTEFVDAEPLSKLRKSDGIPPDFADRLEKLFEEIESRGVFHGDPHFRNILCGRDGQPYLIDFSLSYVRRWMPILDKWSFRSLQVVRRKRLRKLRQVFYHEEGLPEVETGPFYRVMKYLKRLYRRYPKELYKRVRKFRKRRARQSQGN